MRQERTNLNAAGHIGATLGGGALTIVIPLFREMLGGWTATVVFMSVVGAITMLPICFSAKERTQPVNNEQEVGIKEMLRYVKGNKYLLVYYLAFLMRGAFNVMNAWGLYVANLLRWVAGYDNTIIYLVVNVLAYIPSGISCPGITFSVQTFFCKFEGAVMTAFAALALGMLGFVSGENAVQAQGFTEKLWTASCILPTIGIVLALIILRFYKLNDHDVELMAKCNSGEITREEAENQMKNKY